MLSYNITPTTTMNEDIANLQLDKVPAEGKSNTELQQHAVDDTKFFHKPIERSLFLLSKGDDLQKLSVIQSVPELVNFDRNAIVSKILPKIQQELASSSYEIHSATCEMYLTLFKMQVPMNFVVPIIQGIEHKEPAISNLWVDAMISIMPELPESVVKNEVLRCALAKAQSTKSTFNRLGGCKLIGQICMHPKMTPIEVKRDILPLVYVLCQDSFFEVRAAICRELPLIATGFSKLGEPVNMMPLMVELSNDENAAVRTAAVESLVLIIPLLSPASIRSTIVPMFKQLCSRSTNHDDIALLSIAKVYGKVIEVLVPTISSEDAMWFMDFYKHLCSSGSSDDIDTDLLVGPSCLEYCAHDLPIMTVLVRKLLPSEINYWYKIFTDLCNDSGSHVRKAVAACFAKVTEIMSNQNKILKVNFVKLLRDESEEVLQAIVPSIGAILRQFTKSLLIFVESPNQSTLEIVRALLKCKSEVFKTNNYRLKIELLVQMEKLPFYICSEFIHQHFTPTMLNSALKAKARPVRVQAGRTLLVFLRYNVNEIQRKWIRDSILTELCHSNCCYTRIIFVKMCDEAMAVFSWKYFKEHFYVHLLSMAEDPVSNIRLCVVKLCPKLKKMLVLPVDRQLQIKLETTLSKMEITETDKDVLAAIKETLREMASVQMYKSQEMLADERRKIEEEENIIKGKWVNVESSGQISGVQNKQRLSSPGPTQLPMSRLYQKMKKESLSTSTDKQMSFLGKHFYIDAGISLPESKLIMSNINDIDSVTDALSNTHFTESHTHTDKDILRNNFQPNITDDEKASNLQKCQSSDSDKGIVKRSKRASCVFSSEHTRNVGISDSASTSLRRRSLNILSSDTSRIPLSTAGSLMSGKSRIPVINKVNNSIAKENEQPVNSTKVSSLPVFVNRRST